MKLTDENGKEYEFLAQKFNANFGTLTTIKPKLKKIDMSVCIESGIENNIEGEYNLVITRKNKD